MSAALSAVAEVAVGFASASNPIQPLLSAYGFLELMGEASVGALLAQQAALATTALAAIADARGVDSSDDGALRELAQDDEESAFYWGKVLNARFFAARVLSLSPARARRALTDDTSAMDVVF